MTKPRRIYFTVTNDLSYDQRMHRICGSLVEAGFDVCLVGRKLSSSKPLAEQRFRQKRIRCFFNRSVLFYAEYNLRLFFFLLGRRMDAICAIDLDTILPCLLISVLKKIPRVYDAHEYFTELKEVRTRPFIHRCWLAIERFCVPRFTKGYTVSEGLAVAFKTQYGCSYELIRNLPVLKTEEHLPQREDFLLYQGAVNEGRGFEYIIPAMRELNYRLVVCGDGNFMSNLRQLIKEYGVADKVELKGMMMPQELRPLALKAALGIGLTEKEGLNQYYALPNKFLDYIHAGLPQIAMAYPEYEKINREYEVAFLLSELSVREIVDGINRAMLDVSGRAAMQANCMKARTVFCWQQEEKQLIRFYKKLFRLD
ncbi:MAG TPA: glycosyltransferase [Flavisolibacter sp.]|nr:glycosyltransferase [Flavisolibacter sp.]